VPGVRLAAAGAAALLVAACSVLPISGERVGLGNRTNIPVAVHVNGAWVGTYAPGALTDVAIGGHGGPPYVVEVRSPTGSLLAGITISAADAEAAAAGEMSMGSSAGLPCGAIHLSYGGAPEMPQSDPAAVSGPCP
jgi:hypothetical protein